MWILIISSFLIAFIASAIILPYIKNWIENKKKLKEDLNKFKKPRLKSLEGIFCVIIFITTISLILSLQKILNINNFDFHKIIAGLLSVITIALINFIDDILKIPNKIIKYFLMLPAIIPAIIIDFNHRTIDIPSYGPYNISLLYPLLIIPFTILITVAATNTSKKLNTPVFNNYIIISSALIVCAWLKESYTAIIIFSCLLGMFLSLKNYHEIEPKNISLGKIGRSSFGTILAIGAIIGNIKLSLLILITPYLIYLFIWKIYKLILKIKNINTDKIGAIKIFNFKITTKQLLKFIFILETISALIAITLQINRVNPNFIFQLISY